MDILSVISEQTASIALALTIMWFYNKLVQDFLGERKEMIESIRTERREWLVKADGHITQLFDMISRNTESTTALRLEVHALKGRIQELIFSISGKVPPKDD